jgi:hypothetical protein
MITFGSVCSGIEAASIAWNPLGWQAAWLSEIDPAPCALLAHRYPDAPNLGDMTALPERIAAGEVEAPDVLCGGTPCFPAGTHILTRRGFKAIEEIQIGDEVLTHRLRWRRVTATMSRESETVIVKGQGHWGIETTAEHPFWSREVRREWIIGSKKAGGPCWRRIPEAPAWVNAIDLEGRFWSAPAELPEEPVPPFDVRSHEGRNLPTGITADFMRLVGVWLGDGWLRTGPRADRDGQNFGAVMICGNKKDADVLEDMIKRAGLSACKNQERTTVRFTIYSKPLVRWLETEFGRGASGKKIPSWVFSMNRELREALLDGMLFADGHTGRQSKGGGTYRRITTISRALAIGIRMLANTFGLGATIVQNKPKRDAVIENRQVNETISYGVSIYDTSRSAFIGDGMMWGKVRSVMSSGRVARVYNFEIEEDNSYIADGLVVHNCQAFSVAGLRKSLEDERGNLTLKFVEVANAIDAVRDKRNLESCIIFWENVPGVLNTSDNAFGCFIAGLTGEGVPLQPPGGRWTDAGCVLGPRRAVAWRTLDAQYFGLAQRRRRVFVVASARNGFDPCAVLFEREGLRRDSPPSRKEGQGVAGTVSARTKGGGGLGTDFEIGGGLTA